MHRSLSRIAVAAACVLPLATAACESSTEPVEQLVVTLEFGVSRPAFHPDFATSRSGNELTIRGRTATLCNPATGDASVERVGDILMVTLDVLPTAGCAAGQDQVAYNAVVTGFNRLTHLRVVHRWPGSDRADQLAYESVWQ